MPWAPDYTIGMQAERPQALTPPEGLRPAQLGIVLIGRVIVGHASATLVDLGQRGLIGIEEVLGDAGADWVLTDLRGRMAGGGPPLSFEMTLLDGLFGHQPQLRLSKIGDVLLPALNRFRAQLRRDAVRHGWLRRWHADKRTPRGEQLLTQIHRFRRELRTLAAAGDSGVLPILAPYAMIFGLVSSPVSLNNAQDTDDARPCDTEAPWSQPGRFASDWRAACTMFLAVPDSRHGPGPEGHGDFVHDWSNPGDHSHGAHGHDSGHGGYGSGYGDGGGGHHSGFGGHHSGY